MCEAFGLGILIGDDQESGGRALGAKQAAEKGISRPEKLAGAEARLLFCELFGTSKLVP
jgi:hypothetical protein